MSCVPVIIKNKKMCFKKSSANSRSPKCKCFSSKRKKVDVDNFKKVHNFHILNLFIDQLILLRNEIISVKISFIVKISF
jgi:hypothetical protein